MGKTKPKVTVVADDNDTSSHVDIAGLDVGRHKGRLYATTARGRQEEEPLDFDGPETSIVFPREVIVTARVRLDELDDDLVATLEG